ncbi:MAG: N-acetylmuramoyl-L-alanine amidase [Desulfobacterales bacterium]|nr:N-acetylmuramoyl-L-alanine amidase [Desulfobacterales bacterium]
MHRAVRDIGIVLALVIAFVSMAGQADAASTRDRFFQAEKAYRELTRSPDRQKYRHHWLRVIEKYETAYEREPDGEWAAASLYRAGIIWLELHRFSGRTADRRMGVERLQSVATQFSRSAYRARAADKLRQMGIKVARASAPKQAARAPAPKKAVRAPAPKNDPGGRKHYVTAERCRQKLEKNPRRKKHRDVWLTCIDHYEAAFEADRKGETAAQSLLRTGELYLGLSRYSRSDADRDNGMRFLKRVARDYPETPSGKAARKRLGTDAPREKAALSAAKPQPQTAKPAPGNGGAGTNRTVNELRFWSNPNYTRVVIDTDGKVPYTYRLLKKDPDLKKPQRLFVDLRNTRLRQNFPSVVPINDNLLMDARAGQYDPETVRVVMDIKSFKTYKIFSLMNPFRIVIDVWGQSNGTQTADRRETATINVPQEKIPPGSLTRSLALGVSRIVIDAGHGGKDPGARGYYRKAREKDITLSIAKKLAKKIKTRLGCEVILTRNEDSFLTLEERTALANTKNADLFISIHVNAHRNKRAYGTETYFLNLATDEESIRVAAMENATSTRNISDLQTILMDLMQNAKINESSRLAGYVQSNMIRYLDRKYSNVKDKGVKQAPFYVLLGAQMPAILIETAFISNPRECKRLMDPAFQDRLSDGIVSGIEKYIQETSPTAFQHDRQPNQKDG